jgi:hypothetical protein
MSESQEKISTRPAHKSKRLRAHIDKKDMTVKYGRVTLGIPTGFKECLENVTREVLREQPKDIPAFLACYFKELVEDQRNGINNSNLVTKRVIEVKDPLVDEGVQKDESKAVVNDAEMETQDITEARSNTQSSTYVPEEANIEEPMAAPSSVSIKSKKSTENIEKQASGISQTEELSFEEQEALLKAEREAQLENQIEDQNQSDLEDEPVRQSIFNAEQQRAMDMLNHAGEDVNIVESDDSDRELQLEEQTADVLSCLIKGEPIQQVLSRTSGTSQANNDESTKNEEQEGEEQTEEQEEPAVDENSEPLVRQSAPSMSKSVTPQDSREHKSESAIADIDADAVIGESVMELAKESNTQIDQQGEDEGDQEEEPKNEEQIEENTCNEGEISEKIQSTTNIEDKNEEVSA